MVQNARADANCVRAQKGGGREEPEEPLVILSVLSSRIRVPKTRDMGRRSAAARFSRRLHPRGVKLDRLDGHPESKQWDIVRGGPQRFRSCGRAPRHQNDAKRPRYRHGLIFKQFPTIAGSVRVGSNCLSHGLGTQKEIGHCRAPNSRA
jgi:hypothetical protein